ncbi:MAG: bifunctional hydroxymethylpyrimidine kinase/phosphomethylpyrimidine kinase, partial [Burkholderiaceae bacterium]
MSKPIPNALTIAGVDPSGGAGVLADVKAFSALGAYACAVIAALTAQNTRAVTGVLAIAPEFIARQIDTLFADVHIDAVKIGMLGEAPVIATVAERLTHWKAERVVLDPVMVAKSGDALLAKAAVGALREALVPIAQVMTPNLPEAGVLLESRGPESVKEMTRAAERLHALMGSGERWVWLKGGHLPGGDATDLLFNGDRMIEMSEARVATRNTHGTGCTLSAALAALLPRWPDVPTAARHAKDYLTQALRHADELAVGQGHGPVHHFHALWPKGLRPK